MKKILALIFTAALMLSLAACGGVSSKQISGSYTAAALMPCISFELNEDGTYQHGEEKGTYTLDKASGSLSMQPVTGAEYTLLASGEYYHTEAAMTTDTEYGKAPTFDEDGHSHQTFTTEVEGSALTLALREDGSYSFSYGSPSTVNDKLTDTVSFEGNYRLEDTVLFLTWNEMDFPLLFVDDAIYPIVYLHETDANSADIRAKQTAVQDAAKEAADSRWWTPSADPSEIQNALLGTWKYNDGYGNYEFTFNDSSVSIHMDFMGYTALNSTGTYTILNRAILLEYTSASGFRTIRAVPFTFENGTLKLYEMLDIMNEDALLDPAADLASIASYQYQKTAS